MSRVTTSSTCSWGAGWRPAGSAGSSPRARAASAWASAAAPPQGPSPPTPRAPPPGRGPAGPAASPAVAAFQADDMSSRRLSLYEKGWKREIGRELLRSLRIRHFGLALGDAEVERIVRALRGTGLQALAARHGDIDYPSRVLLRLARSAPALALLGWVTLRRPGAAWNLLRAHLPFAI